MTDELTPEQVREWREDAEAACRYYAPTVGRRAERILALATDWERLRNERDEARAVKNMHKERQQEEIERATDLRARLDKVRALADEWEACEAGEQNRMGDPVHPSAFNRGYWHGLAESAGDLRAVLTGDSRDNVQSADRTGSTWLVTNAPCPHCSNHTVIGYLLVDEAGKHRHTYYVCTFWRSSEPARCGWSGWLVPNEQQEDDQ
jgi:hypothetical protein